MACPDADSVEIVIASNGSAITPSNLTPACRSGSSESSFVSNKSGSKSGASGTMDSSGGGAFSISESGFDVVSLVSGEIASRGGSVSGVWGSVSFTFQISADPVGNAGASAIPAPCSHRAWRTRSACSGRESIVSMNNAGRRSKLQSNQDHVTWSSATTPKPVRPGPGVTWAHPENPTIPRRISPQNWRNRERLIPFSSATRYFRDESFSEQLREVHSSTANRTREHVNLSAFVSAAEIFRHPHLQRNMRAQSLGTGVIQPLDSTIHRTVG